MKPSASELVEQIKRIVAAYPDAPAGILDFTWITVPRYWERLRVPSESGREVMIAPRQEDQHAGACFRVGWNEDEQVVALWVL